MRPIYSKINKVFFGLVDYFKLHQNTYTILISAGIGIIGGFGAIGFRFLIDFVQSLSIGGGEEVIDALKGMAWYWKILIPAIGGCLVGPLVYFFVREAKGHGVPEVMEAIALKGGRIRPRLVLGKALVSAITIGTGGSVGREGPIVQIGSAAGSSIGQALKLSHARIRTLVGCGAAAGIAATFNAPIAGVLFAVEIILGNFALHTFSPLVVSSVLATVVSRHYLGDVPAFIVPTYLLRSPWELPLYLIFGIIIGGLAVLYSKSVYKMEDIFEAVKIPGYFKTPIGLALVGIIICFFPHVFGVGYETIGMALHGNIELTLLLLLIPIKILATSLTLGAGGSGGIFAPSLFIGAVAGGAFGSLMNYLFPAVTATSGAYAIVGMGAMTAAATHAPVTAMIILFELTGDYKIILPLMFACIVSTLIAKQLQKDSIYTEKLSRRGIKLNVGLESTIMTEYTVEELMHINVPTLKLKMAFRTVFNQIVNSREIDHHVVDDEATYKGTISFHKFMRIFHEKGIQCELKAEDLMSQSIPTVSPHASLMDAMNKFGIHDVEEMPVVEPDTGRFMGTITHQDIIGLYNREILRQGTLGLRFITKEEQRPRSDYVHVPKDYKVILVPVVGELAGKSIEELDLRKRFDVSIVALRPPHGGETTTEIPKPGRVLTRNDVLIVVGPKTGLSQLKETYKLY